MEISAFSMMEDILCKIASSMSEVLWQSVVEVSSLCLLYFTYCFMLGISVTMHQKCNINNQAQSGAHVQTHTHKMMCAVDMLCGNV